MRAQSSGARTERRGPGAAGARVSMRGVKGAVAARNQGVSWHVAVVAPMDADQREC